MRSWMRMLPALGILATLGPTLPAQTPLQKELKDTEVAPHWIYDDLPKAKAQAKESGKPLLVVLRCVPCPPGSALDNKLKQPDKDLEALEKNFVCVRVIQTKGLDLKTFQYDYDQSWAAFFLNADGTVYGRYGTRVGRAGDSDTYLTLSSFQKAAERALELHKGYPANKKQLASKLAKAADYNVPEEIPGLQDRAKGETTRQTCIHCHMVKEFALRAKWKDRKLTIADLHVYPMPNNIGLRMDPADGVVVKNVIADSPAAKAGLAAGDELVSIDDQPLVSLADIQWVLHTAPDDTTLAVKLRRDGKTLDKMVGLKGNWKESDIGWRASSWYGLRQGLKLDPLTAEERKKRGIADGDLALVVKNMFGVAAKELPKAGLKNNDVVVAIDGKTAAMTESQFLIDLRLKHGPDDSVKLTILRGTERKELTVPMW